MIQGYNNATASSVKIHLEGYASTEAATALANQTKGGGGVTINLSDGTKIIFQNVKSLDSSDFIS